MTEKLDSAPPKPALKVSSSEGTSHLWTFPKLHPLLALEHDTTQNKYKTGEERDLLAQETSPTGSEGRGQ